MNLRWFLRRRKTQLLRRLCLRGVESVADVRSGNPEFADMRAKICELGTDNLAYFGSSYHFEGGYCLQQNPDEFAALCLLLRRYRPITNYLEIGTASGGTCLALHREAGFENSFSIDDGRHARADQQPKLLSQVPNLQQFIGDSHSSEARCFLETRLQGKLDVAFIDGDHSDHGVWADVQLLLPFSRPGTLFIFHDTRACDGVETVWLKCVHEKILRPVAEYIGAERPMGIGVGSVV